MDDHPDSSPARCRLSTTSTPRRLIDTFPDVESINRIGNLNAMDDPHFAAAVNATGRRKLILSGIRPISAWYTRFCH